MIFIHMTRRTWALITGKSPREYQSLAILGHHVVLDEDCPPGIVFLLTDEGK